MMNYWKMRTDLPRDDFHIGNLEGDTDNLSLYSWLLVVLKGYKTLLQCKCHPCLETGHKQRGTWLLLKSVIQQRDY